MKRQSNSDKAARVFAAALSASAPAMSAPIGDFLSLTTDCQVSNSGDTGVVVKATTASEVPNQNRITRPNSWTKAHSRRFIQLSEKEALGRITPEDLNELETLSMIRRELQFPRTADEILAEIRQRDAISKLVEALHDCAKVIPSNS